MAKFKPTFNIKIQIRLFGFALKVLVDAQLFEKTASEKSENPRFSSRVYVEKSII